MLEKYFKNHFIVIAADICALILILEMYYELYDLNLVDWYCAMFSDLPDWQLAGRYVISITVRVATIIVILGLLLRKDFCRKILLWIAWYNALSVYWRHPYSAFENISRYTGFNSEDFAQIATYWGHPFYPGVLNRMLWFYYRDILISAVMILVFSHPMVKKIFR